MSDPNQPTAPPGWYPDGQGGQRWWDGTQWTEHTQPPPQRTQAQQQGYGAPQQFEQPGYGAPGGAAQSGGGGHRKMIAIIGGAVGALVIVVVLLVVLLKVLGGSGPEDTARDYLEAKQAADLRAACELSTKDWQEKTFNDDGNCSDAIDEFEEQFENYKKAIESGFDTTYAKIKNDTESSIEIDETEEDGDEATVDWKTTSTYTGDNDDYIDQVLDGDTSQKDDGTMLLCKEDGDWKVQEDHYAKDSGDGC
ncbi:MAG: DUF2510 domain-containing protein [Nocardioidaceae bacterium]|nr:DUF2510 domain-containing protein [Nocardioidaceae bacterium]